MSQVEIIVLANSVKHNQHCVAGKLLDNSQWVRPVSNPQGGELSDEQARIQNPHGIFYVKPLQKIYMGLSSHAPLPHQPENYVTDNTIWRQHYRIEVSELINYLDTPTDIWGQSDRVVFSQIQSGHIKIEQSLYLLKVSDLKLYKNQYNKRRASFIYNQTQFDLAATDPNFDRLLQDQSELQGVICVSLGEEYQGHCFKLVATIF
jgi:hypothetical protein